MPWPDGLKDSFSVRSKVGVGNKAQIDSAMRYAGWVYSRPRPAVNLQESD